MPATCPNCGHDVGFGAHHQTETCLRFLTARVYGLEGRLRAEQAALENDGAARAALVACGACPWWVAAPKNAIDEYARGHAGATGHEVEVHALGMRWKLGPRRAPGILP